MTRKAKADKALAMAASVRDVQMRDMVRGKLVSILNVIPTEAQVDAAMASGAWATSAPALVTGAATAKPSKAKAKSAEAEAKSAAWVAKSREFAERREARRKLAAALKAAGKPTSGPEWVAAKLAAGIK